ncbi:MAG: hypothetical protein H6739_30720 [Alphaproteobacteria bacterium]|nr:hypothetical protein [Alphaproteobacteria bacterium]
MSTTSWLKMGLVLLVAGCTEPLDGFPGGGHSNQLPSGGGGTSDDTGSTVDTADTSDTSDTSETGDTSDTGIPGGDRCGRTLGSVGCDLVGYDTRGERWSLWAAYGDPVVVVIGSAWDQSFQQISATLQATSDANQVVAAVVLLDALDQLPAETSDADHWAASYGLRTVLTDDDGTIRQDWTDTTSTRVWVFDDELVIRLAAYGYVDPDDLDALLSELSP